MISLLVRIENVFIRCSIDKTIWLTGLGVATDTTSPSFSCFSPAANSLLESLSLLRAGISSCHS